MDARIPADTRRRQGQQRSIAMDVVARAAVAADTGTHPPAGGNGAQVEACPVTRGRIGGPISFGPFEVYDRYD